MTDDMERPRRTAAHDFRCDVEPEGDWMLAWRQGELLALDALDRMVRADDGGFTLRHFLGDLALDRPSADEYRGVVLGFFNAIGAFAAQTRQVHGDTWYRNWLDRQDKTWEGLVEAEKRKRSEHGRKAARARWDKQKGNVVRFAGRAS